MFKNSKRSFAFAMLLALVYIIPLSFVTYSDACMFFEKEICDLFVNHFDFQTCYRLSLAFIPVGVIFQFVITFLCVKQKKLKISCKIISVIETIIIILFLGAPLLYDYYTAELVLFLYVCHELFPLIGFLYSVCLCVRSLKELIKTSVKRR